MSRIQNLIGYQLINKTNMADISLLDSNKLLRWLDPITEEPLMAWTQPPEPENPKLVPATIEDVKRLVGVCMQIIQTEGGMVFEFCNRYQSSSDINAGLQQFTVTKAQIDDDISMVRSTKDTLDTSLAVETKENKIILMANSFKDWIPEVKKEVQAYEISQYEQTINTFQDLFNAMAFELQGKNSYTGELHGHDVPTLKNLIASRMRVSNRAWTRTPQTEETKGYKTTLEYLDKNFNDAITLNDLKTLGVYIDSHVPQIPLVRRWWNNGA